jgi:hypothetical protein
MYTTFIMPIPLLAILAGAVLGKASKTKKKKVAVSGYTTKKKTKVAAYTRKKK